MKYTTLPNTQLTVSEICLGTGDLGGTIERKTSFQILDAFIDQGGTFIDTAAIYNDWIPGEKSRSEKLIGAWVNLRKNRDHLVITTKGAHPRLESMQVGRLSRQEIFTDLESSLANLQTGLIDLYWLHRDDRSRPVGDILETLNTAVEMGKIRYFGASNWRADRLEAARVYAAEHNLRGFAADQMLWNAACIDREGIPDKTIEIMEKTLFDFHTRTGMAAVAFTSQANGLFSHIAAGTLDSMKPDLLNHFPLEANLARYERIQKVMQDTNLTLTQVVLGWLLSQPFLTIPIVGCKTVQQVKDSLTAAGVRLQPNQLEWIAAD